MSRNITLGAIPAPQFTFYLVPAAYSAIFFYLYLIEDDYRLCSLVVYSLAVFTMFYGIDGWLPNWILWVSPLVLYVVLRRPQMFQIYLLMLTSFFTFAQGGGNSLWIGLFRPLSESLLYFPNLWDLMPRFYPSLVGLAYTTISVSLLFITHNARKDVEAGELTPIWHWLGLILIPVFLALATFFLGVGYLQEHGLPILNTLLSSIAEDPSFFAFYFSLICVVSLWGIVAISRRSKRSTSSAQLKPLT